MATNASYWTVKRKRDCARRMVLSGHMNQEIKDHLVGQCGSAISSTDLATIRKKANKPGKNVKSSKNGSSKSSSDVLILPTTETSPLVKQAISQLVQIMKSDGIDSIIITRDGTVKMRRMEDVEFSV